MQKITDSVGDGGANKVSDVVLIQAILLKTLKPAAVPAAASYLNNYDGDCGNKTKAAIRAFQADHVFVTGDGLACAPNPRATDGVVKLNDATWEKLLEKVPVAFSDMRVLPGGKIVYVAATAEQLQSRISAVAGLTFALAFRTKVVACINLMHEGHGIAIGVCREGDRRTFQTQYDLLTSGRNVTSAGPGESNHNFGMAVDLGFEKLRWLKKNGEVVEKETSWFHVLNPEQNVIGSEELLFWEKMRSVGTSSPGLFRGPMGDRPHLQNWDDSGVDMATRLADLLTRSGTMRWRGARQAYSCDLGMGGEYYPVGSARQIWARQSTVTAASLTLARVAQAAATAASQIPAPATVPRGGPRIPPVTPPVTPADLTAMKQALRSEFELADANWQNWTPR